MSKSLSAYARQFLEMMQKPDVDQIDGLSPAISIEQKTTSNNPRSTVGTVTEIYDYMRLLWARVGVPYSPATGLPIESQTVSQMVDRVMALPEGTRLYLLAPIVRGRKGEYRKELADCMKKGFQRVKIDGKFYEIAEAPALDKKFKHDIDVVVDRIVVRADIAHAAGGFARTALKLADGLAIAEFADGAASDDKKQDRQDRTTSPARSASSSRRSSPARSPASPFRRSSRGCSPSTTRSAPARPATGSASSSTSTPSWSSPTRTRTLRKGAIAPWAQVVLALLPPDAAGARQALQVHARHQWKDLPKKTQDAILYGTGEDAITLRLRRRHARLRDQEAVRGRHPQSRAPLAETESAWAREEIGEYFTDIPCAACDGYRLKPEALASRSTALHIGEVAELSVQGAGEWFAELPAAADQQAERDRRRASSRRSASG